MNYQKKLVKVNNSKRKVPHHDGSQFSWHINARSNEDFARQLQQKLDQHLLEFNKSGRKSRKERYTIFSQCFEEIVRYHSSYATLLYNIKHEYENCIQTLCHGKKEEALLHRNLISGSTEKRTLENYEQRIRDLEEKSRVVRENNNYLREKLKKLEGDSSNGSDLDYDDENHNLSSSRGQLGESDHYLLESHEFGKFRIKVLKRFSSSQQTNLAFLSGELRRLQHQVQELVRFFDKRFELRKTKKRLVEKLMEKENLKSELQEKCKTLKEKLLKLEEKIKQERKTREMKLAKPPRTMAELILLALKHDENDEVFVQTIQDGLTVDQYGNKKIFSLGLEQEREQEEMVEYMETFEQLFNQGNYEEAAIVAATSPQDILRTTATFQRFKEQRSSPGEKSPLLLYCEAVIENAASPDQKGLSAAESSEAVERALEEGRYELVVQWISRNNLKYSDGLGDTIVSFCRCGVKCDCGRYSLAEVVYRETKAHSKVLCCLYKQGRPLMAVYYARNVAKFRKLKFMDILREYPSFEHAMLLLQIGEGYLSSPLSREECIVSLVKASSVHEAARLLTSSRDRIKCSKMIYFVKREDRELWIKFKAVLELRGFAEAAQDVLCALILAGVFRVVNIILSL